MAVARDPSRPHVALRAATPRDADQLRRWRAEPTVRRFQPLNDLSTAQLRSDVAAQRIADLYRGRGEKFQWIVEVDAAAAGWVTLVISNWEHGLAEVGYALATAYQGRGLMVDALEALLADLFAHTPLERIEARCSVDNHASRRVLEKCGFTHEGVLRSYFRLHGRRIDNLLYAVLREEWGRGRPVGCR